jgi:hypothetical protein
MRDTWTMCSRSPTRTRTESPIFTDCDGLTRSPFTRTCPALHAAVASERVFVSRTAQIQLSTRTEESCSIPRW